jgi:DNA-binding SARP family transcriptional activator
MWFLPPDAARRRVPAQDDEKSGDGDATWTRCGTATQLPQRWTSVVVNRTTLLEGESQMIEFRALGALAVVVDGEEVAIGGPRQRRLLAMLLVHHDDVVSADRLADAVFDGEPTDAALTTLRSYVARTRRVIGADSSDVRLITQAPGYALRTSPGSFDAVCFEQCVEEGRRQLATGDPALAAVSLQSALKMWAGPAYAEFANEQWAQPEAQRLEELRLAALERLVDAELECGRAADTIPKLEALVKDHPLREAFRAQQMLALYRAGRQVDALRVFRRSVSNRLPGSSNSSGASSITTPGSS